MVFLRGVIPLDILVLRVIFSEHRCALFATTLRRLHEAVQAGSRSNAMLALFVGFEVELEMNPRIERPVGLLRLVLPVDLGKLQIDGLRSRRLAVGGALYDAGDDDIVHLDDEEFLLPLARLPKRDRSILQVLTRRARLQQIRRRLVDFVNDGKIPEGCLAGATAAPAAKTPGICDAPRVR